MKVYLQREGEREGPYDVHQIRDLVFQGAVEMTTMLQLDGEGGSITAKAYIRCASQPTPATPKSEVPTEAAAALEPAKTSAPNTKAGCGYLTVLVIGVLLFVFYNIASNSSHTSERSDMHSRYLALKTEEALLMKELDMARARRDTKAIPELSRKVDDFTKRMNALTAEKLQADRDGKK